MSAEDRAVMDALVAVCTAHGRAATAKAMLTLIHRWCRQGVAMADAAADGRPAQGELPLPRVVGTPGPSDPKEIGPVVQTLAEERKP